MVVVLLVLDCMVVLECVLCGLEMMTFWCPVAVWCDCSLFLCLIQVSHCLLWSFEMVLKALFCVVLEVSWECDNFLVV